SQVIDRHRRPVIVDLTTLGFCDASGLSSLLRMAGDAQQAGCPFRLASPSPSLVKIMRITGLDHRFLAPGSRPPDSSEHPRLQSTPASRAQTRTPADGERPFDPASQAERWLTLWTWLDTHSHSDTWRIR